MRRRSYIHYILEEGVAREPIGEENGENSINECDCETTTTKPFVPSIWGRLHEPKENYAG